MAAEFNARLVEANERTARAEFLAAKIMLRIAEMQGASPNALD